jgi:hypothetical protein
MGKQQKRPPLKLVGEERPPLNLIGVKKKVGLEQEDTTLPLEVSQSDTSIPQLVGSLESQTSTPEIPIKEPEPESKEDGFGSELFRSLQKGSARLGRDIASIPELVFDVFAAPQNFIAEQFGIENLATNSERLKTDLNIKNSIKDYYAGDIERLNKLSEELDRKYIGGITDNFKAGNIGDGFRILGNSLAESLPSTLSIAFGGAATKAPQLLGAVTATFAAGKNAELKSNPDITNNIRVLNALGTGLAEGVFSTIGTGRIGVAAKELIAKEGVEQGAKILKKNLIDIYTELLKKYPIPTAMLGEGLEESTTQITQNAIDKYTGVSPDINLMQGVSDAFILGVGSGGAFGTALEGIKKISKEKTTKEDVEVVESSIEKRNVLEEELNQQIKEGEIPNQLASETIANFDEIRKQLQAIPKDYTSDEKAIAIDLLKERAIIESEMEGLDESLLGIRISQIAEINEELRNIKKPQVESTVLEQTTEFANELGTPEDISDTVAGATSVKVGDTEIILKSEGDNIVLESIRTDEDKKGQGSARNALDKITEVADAQVKTIELKVVPETDSTTEEGLISLYESVGFVKDGNKMVREPKTEDTFSNIDKVIDETTTETTQETEVDEVLSEQNKKAQEQKETTEVTKVAKDVRSLYNIHRDLFELDRVKSFASATVTDRIITTMAKRQGISKAEMYAKIDFKKGDSNTIDKLNKKGKALFQIVGENALLKEQYKNNLQLAKELDGEGKTSEEIWFSTGWEKGTDGKWKTEIDDSKMELDGDLINLRQYNLSEAIKYDALFEAYPELKDIKISFSHRLGNLLGVYMHDRNRIVINSELSVKETRSTLLHEIQHAVQKKEGFAAGGSAVIASNYLNQKIRAISLSKNLPTGLIRVAKKLNKKMFEGVDINATKQEFTKEVEKAKGQLSKEEFELYSSIAGEVEATNVETRMDLTAEQRRTTPLSQTEDIAREEQIVLFQKSQGAMLVEDGKFIIYALTNPNVSTPLHEMAHVYEHFLTSQERSDILKFTGKKQWNRETSEEFSKGFEKYLADGKAPTKSLQKIFDKFKEWLIEIYNGVTDSDIDVKLSPKMQNIYTEMLNVETKTQDKRKTTTDETTLKPNVFETDKNNYTVTVKDGKLDIVPEFGKAKPSKSEIKKVTEQYLDKNDFTIGKTANVEDKPNISPEQLRELVAAESENAQEIAIEVLNSKGSDSQININETKEGSIAEALKGVQVNKESFANTDDVNNISSVNQYYFNSRNKSLKGNDGNIDRIRERAQQNTSEEVTLKDVTDFIKENSSPTQFLKQKVSAPTTDLEIRFEEVTGLKPTPENVSKVSGIQVTGTEITEEGDVPFQVESTQVKIKGTALTNLVDRLKKTGLSSDVIILSDNQFKNKLESLGRDVIETPLGFISDNTVYLNRDTVKKDTPIHEFGHLWNNYAKENFNDVFNKGIDLIKDSEYFENISDNPNYENLTENEKLEEALSQAIGEKGVKILNESARAKFNAWFKNLFTRIAKGLGITTLKGKQLSDITLDKFTDLVSAELLSGKKITTEVKQKSEPKTRVKEADVTNIDLVVKEQEAIKKTKDTLTQKFNDKKAEVKDIKKSLVKYINSNIDSKRFNEQRKGELGKLLTLVKNTESKKALQKAFNNVNKIVQDIDNRIIKKRIDKILDSKLSKKQSGRVKANITTEQAEIILKSVKENVVLPKTNDQKPAQRVEEKLFELYDKRDALHAKEELTEEDFKELEILDISINYLNGVNSDDANNRNIFLGNALQQIESIFEDGRSDLKEQIQARNEKDQAFTDAWIEDIDPEGTESRLSVKELENKEKIVGNLATRILNKGYFLFFQGQATGSFGSLTSLISNKGGETRESSFGVQIDSNLKKDETAKKTRIKKFTKLFDDTVKDVFEDSSKANRIMNKRVDVELLRNYENDDPNTPKYPVKVPFTYSELLNVLQIAKNESQLGGLEANGFTKEVIDKIEKQLPSKLKEFGDKLFDLYNEAYIDANKVYENMYFHSLGKPDFYAGKVYREGVDTKVEDQLFKEGVTKNTGYGSQKERVNNNKKIVPKDVRFLYQRHISESSHFVAFAESHRQLNKSLKSDDLLKSILVTNPKNGTRIINELDYYKVRDLEKADFANYWLLDFFTRNIAKATLSLKGKIGLTQTISIVNGSLDMPTNIKFKDFIAYYEPARVIKTMIKLLKESDYLKNRYDVGGIESAMFALSNEADQNSLEFSNESLESKRKKVARIYKKVTDLAMINVKIGDAIGVMGSIPMYNAWIDTFIKRGDSRPVAEKKALDLFESSVDRSQQTISTFGKSRWQKDPIIRYFMMFTSSPVQAQQNANYYRRQLYKDVFTQKAFRGSRGRNILGFLNYQFAQPYLYYYISALMAGSVLPVLGIGDEEPDDTDKDLTRALILGNAQSIPILGNAMTYGVDMLLLDKDHSYGGLMSSPILEKIMNIETFIDRSVKAKSEATRTKNLNKALKEFSNVLVAMPNFAIDFYNDFNDVYWNSEIDADIKIPKALGYSDFVIKKARTKRMSRKEVEARIKKAKKKYDDSVDKLNKTETERQRQKRINKIFGEEDNR